MNLSALIEKVKNLTDYSPELAQFNNQLAQIINDAHYSLWTYKRWNFATQEISFKFYPDMTPTRDNENVPAGGGGVNASVTEGDRRVTFSADMDRLLAYRDIWEGNPIAIQGNEYTISKVLDAKTLLLVEPFQGTTFGDETDWLIKARWYDLPQDLLELLYIGHRDYPYNTVTGTLPPYGKITGLLPRKEEDAPLRVDYAMPYAEAYIPAPTQPVASAEVTKLESINAIGGDYTTGKYYEICWAFVKDGMMSALSEPQTVLIGEGHNAIRVSFVGWDSEYILADAYNSKDQQPTQWEGYRKVIFFNKNFNKDTGDRKGLPCWVQIVNGGVTRNTSSYLEPVIASDLDNFYEIKYKNQMDNGSFRYIEIDGNHQQLRFYPRVDGWDFEQEQQQVLGVITVIHDYIRLGRLRYYRKPKDMLLGTDSPEIPFEFHPLIVYKALEDIYLKLGQASMAATYEKKYTKELQNLTKRYVDKIDQQVQRGQFSFQSTWRGYDASQLQYKG